MMKIKKLNAKNYDLLFYFFIPCLMSSSFSNFSAVQCALKIVWKQQFNEQTH